MNDSNQLRDVFDAIADPTRRRLIRLLAEAAEVPLHELTAQFPMGRTGVSKNFTIIEEEGIALDRKVGRLSYVWARGEEQQTVNWTIRLTEDGKVNLHLEQTGFSNAQGLEGARYGWNSWFGKFEEALHSN